MAQPVQKRARIEPAEASEETAILPEISEIDNVFDSISTEVDGSDQIDISSLAPTLFKLKRWQRQFMLMQEDLKDQLEKEIKSLQKEERALAALQYEREYVEREIAGSSQKTPSLEKLARSEIKDDEALSTEQVVLAFLKADVSNPSDKQRIISRLHQEINSRGGLERDLKLKQEELEAVQTQLKEKSAFLDNLPKQLETLERASNPLQKFMLSHSSTRSIRMTGSERRSRIEQARELPAPLYALYHQLQHYLDQRGDEEVEDCKLPSVGLGGLASADSQQVTFQLPVTDISTAGKKKKVTIHFQFIEKANLVVAFASGCATALNQDHLLDELFQGDTPEPIDESCAGRPYNWCNYIAGLYVPAGKACSYSSVRTIVRAIQRRIVSNSTLKYLLLSLQRSTVPALPTGSKELTLSRLVSFTPDGSGKNDYIVKVSENQNLLCCKVHIEATTYPSKPPRWYLNEAVHDSLYDARLGALEEQVNVKLLERLIASDRDEDYEWILVHQLNEIMAAWSVWNQ